MEDFVQENNGDVKMKVKVSPNSDDFEVKGVNKWTDRLKIKLSSSARGGEANKELIERMENILGKSITIKTGRKSRKKILTIKSSSESEVKRKLDVGE